MSNKYMKNSKKIFGLVLLAFGVFLMLQPIAKAPAELAIVQIFSDGFEGGTTPYDSVSGTPTVQGSVVHNGLSALACDASGEYATKMWTSTTKAVVSFWVCVSQVTTTYEYFFWSHRTGGYSEIHVGINGTETVQATMYGDSISNVPFNFVSGVWYNFQVTMDVVANTATLTVNGNSAGSIAYYAVDVIGMDIGARYRYGVSPWNTYIDDITVQVEGGSPEPTPTPSPSPSPTPTPTPTPIPTPTPAPNEFQVSIEPSGNVGMLVGENKIFTATVLNGIEPYMYHWYLNDVDQGVGNETFNTGALALGSYSVYVRVTDANGQVAASNIVSLTVSESLPSPTPTAPPNVPANTIPLLVQEMVGFACAVAGFLLIRRK